MRLLHTCSQSDCGGHIDNAIALAKKIPLFTPYCDTVEGELVNPGGSMSGGAFKNSSNLLARNREIEELEKRVDQTLNKA